MKGKFRAIWRVSFALVLALSVGLVMAPVGEVGADTQEFATNGTFNWTVPAGVSQITVEAWGGGGAGGGSNNYTDCEGVGGAGGGGGAYAANSTVSVTPGQILWVIVGAEGTGVSGANGTAGGDSFVGPDTNSTHAYVLAVGGSGGTANTGGGSPSGGAGGTIAASVGDTRLAGQNGTNGDSGPLVYSGSGGDGANGGSGGAGFDGAQNKNGNPGNAPGGGGSGGRTSGQGGAHAGGAGAVGRVVITWVPSVVYDLTVAAAPPVGGTATDLTGSSPYPAGTVVNINATAAACYQFANWTAPTGTFGNETAAVTNFTMPAQDVTVTANFVSVCVYNLTMAVAPPGGGTATDLTGTSPYLAGTVVSISAVATTDYEFCYWQAPAGTFGNTHAAATTFSMPAQNVTVTAHFCGPGTCYKLTTSSTAGGSVTTPGEGVFNYPEGNVVSLVASPDTGYAFGNWSGHVATIADVHDASTNITMEGFYSITANFIESSDEYDLTISSTTGGSVTTPGEGTFTYNEGTVVDLVSEADEDYFFEKWTGGVTNIDDVNAASTTITMPGQNVAVTANFEEVLPSVTTQAASGVTTDSATLNMNYAVGNYSPVEVCFLYKKSADSAWSSPDWVSKSASGTYTKSLTGLDSETEYEFKAQLKYDSTVIEGTARQFTTEAPSTPEPTGGWCFIATAAYGTPTAEQIDVLRDFRDVVLLESTLGSQFVALYYQLSPPVADFIARSDFLRTLVRELLVDPVVWMVETTGAIWRN